MNNYVEPEFNKKGFTCFKCGTYSNHDWNKQFINYTTGTFHSYKQGDDIRHIFACKCQQCGFISFWIEGQLMWPLKSNVEMPLEEMPEEIKDLYNEAKNVYTMSPKSSCAILRLALQKFCNKLVGRPEDSNLDTAIKELVKQGLPIIVQKSMDTIRVIGNEAVHPGQINIDDNKEIAMYLFKLMNIIVEKMIIEPNKIQELYELIPENKRKGIEERDKKEDI